MRFDRLSFLGVAAAAVLFPAVAQCEVKDFVFRGNRLGDALEEVKKRAGGKLECEKSGADGRFLCDDLSLDRKTVGSKERFVLGEIVLNWPVAYSFYDGRLSAISFSVSTDQWEVLRKTVAEKYGPQTGEKTQRAFVDGKSRENLLVEWQTNDGTLTLTKFDEGASVEQSRFFIGSMKLALLKVEREKAKAAEAAGKSKSSF